MEEVKAKLGTLISEKKRSARPDNGASWEQAFRSTFDCLDRLGIGNDQVSERLRVIHIAGTKGKGSTSAFCESILRHAGCKKTGLFTSPHLVNINERIRLDGKSISDEKFCEYFWQVWNRLEETCTPEQGMPAYFRFITLMGYYVFIKEEVDVAVVEVGLGGRIDSTNVVNRPVVCGIASLGFDHTDLLGDTLAKIAREKAGIFKKGVPAFTVGQEEEAMESLRDCASERGVEFLKQSGSVGDYCLPEGSDQVRLGIPGDHQAANAGLAVSLCQTFQERVDLKLSPVVSQGALTLDCLKGLELCRWPGRGQIEKDNPGDGGAENITFYLDGAHTPESMLCCSKWYQGATKLALEASSPSSGERWLMFNCMRDRDPNVLFEPLQTNHGGDGATGGAHTMGFDRSFFVPFVSSTTSLKGDNQSDHKWENGLRGIWDKMLGRAAGGKGSGGREALGRSSPDSSGATGGSSSSSSSSSVCSVQAALSTLRTYARQNNTKQIHVLVTGSLYLVGDFLRILKRVP
ncbi:folylpolyglutamate synthase [Chloropicon primus]|uniref:Folylpolyglutamate synthase n=1 Tax=Chloropicon primus TaxID=1764295 RepID=A0A5B8MK82_9CHLO|nr:folylpolyglutamate synthase [Chloropicon primus]UPR00076.1 folylpolyglutamate synthase [Chloropicon primus]|eukprot:QDZ20863.1 folylpolyglutamate synthase [Chloropicon primus]